jgi:alkaline phosphatase
MHRRIIVTGIALVVLLAGSVAIAGATGDRSNTVRNAIDRGRAKNVILLIGDGMGDSEITLARNYTVGAAGRLALDELPLTGQMTTYSLSRNGKPNYTPDSAAAATAWSTGQKTVNGRISTSSTDGDLTTILELAKQAHLRTGNVTTAELTDATPASPMAHVGFRSCQDPLNMTTCPQDRKSAGGPGSIAEQAIEHQVDVLLGGGKMRFDQIIPAGEGPYAGQTVIQEAQSLGYTLVTDKAGLLAAQPGTKLLGLFASGNMSLDWGGLAAKNPPVGPGRCTTGLQAATEPTLADMTAKALQLLDARIRQPGRHRPGFFLQVEGASIDKSSHEAQPCEQIGETVDFDAAVRVALDFAKEKRDTLVIVTGDHGQAGQIVEPGVTPAGASSILVTDEGAKLMYTYGTSEIDPTSGFSTGSQHHTGTQIRVAAQGPQAANVVGLIDQTRLFEIMSRALGVQ